MPDPLDAYRGKRRRGRTPEPLPDEATALPTGSDDTFVVQEHHATRLHWDLRLERGGVLVSWAVPKGLPPDPSRNHLAVHTEDHPLSYAAFSGEIPKGEYGGGTMTIWDRGTYETEKWSEREVMVVLHGSRVSGRYVLFRTDGDQWMIHRMDPPADPDWEPVPKLIRPMLATSGTLPPPTEDARWAYEMKWDGVRAVAYVEGGTVRLLSRNDREITASYPELRALGPALGSRDCVLDGEIVAFDDDGRISFSALQQRMHVTGADAARKLAKARPVTYLLFDVLHVAGHSTASLPYTDRRALLDELDLAGPRWATPPYFPGGGAAASQTSRDQGLEGVVAKRLDSGYEPGRRTRNWVKVKHVHMQEVVVGGWKPGAGRRAGTIGSLLLGVTTSRGLQYAGHVGTGFSDAVLADLSAQLRRLEQRSSPFVDAVPRADAKDAHWVSPQLVGEVAFGEWTPDGRLRHPAWRGLRPDKEPAEATPEDARPDPREAGRS